MTDASVFPVASAGTTYKMSGSNMSAYVLNKISVGTPASPSGNGSIAYNSGTGVLTYTPYALPTASTSTLGGVKVDGSTITINGSGVISASSPVTFTNLTDIVFNQSPTVTPSAGMVWWNANQGGLEVQLDTNTSATASQDNFYYVKAQGAITKGQLCYFVGTDGASGHLLASSAASGITNGSYLMGIAAEAISNGSFGYIQWSGTMLNMNTSAFNTGDILYYDSVNGGMTATYPTTGIIAQVAAVIYKHASQGSYQVRLTSQQRITGTGIAVSQTSAGAALSLTSNTIVVNGTTLTLGDTNDTITAAAGTLTGTTLNSTVVSSSLTSVGTLGSLTVSGATTLKDVRDTVYPLTYASTLTPDAANGDVQTVTLTGNVTISAFNNPVSGQTISLIITQDGTGGRTLTSTMKFAGGFKTLSTAANAIDILHISYFGSTYYASLVTGYA